MRVLKVIYSIVFLLLSSQTHADDFRVFDFDLTMPIDTPWLRIISSQEEWRNFYFDLMNSNGLYLIPGPNGEIPDPPHIVDFESNHVIAGGLGIRYDELSKIVVSDVDSTIGDKLNINVIDLTPSNECVILGLAVTTHPMVVIEVPKSDKPLSISVEEASIHCR
jgi:hypothetical protein